MLSLKFMNETHKAEKIIKTESSIFGYDEKGVEVFAYRGISDFTAVSLTDDNGYPTEFSAPEPTESDRLRALESAMLAMMMGGASNV